MHCFVEMVLETETTSCRQMVGGHTQLFHARPSMHWIFTVCFLSLQCILSYLNSVFCQILTLSSSHDCSMQGLHCTELLQRIPSYLNSVFSQFCSAFNRFLTMYFCQILIYLRVLLTTVPCKAFRVKHNTLNFCSVFYRICVCLSTYDENSTHNCSMQRQKCYFYIFILQIPLQLWHFKILSD